MRLKLTLYSGTPDWYTFDQKCAYPVNEYMWLNSLHPTFPTHNATAWDIVAFLNAQNATRW
jgi:phospholipase/lecithinase/hemolysin